jgi:hypothetical protein
MSETVTTQTALIRQAVKAMLSADPDPRTIRSELEYLARHDVPVFDLVLELVSELSDRRGDDYDAGYDAGYGVGYDDGKDAGEDDQ